MTLIDASPDRDEFASELDRLRAEIEAGGPAPTLGNKPSLPLADISVLPEVFQPRDQGQQAVSDKFHVADLVKQIEHRGELGLDPIVVLWSGKEWLVVDGHHRLAAYKQSEAWGEKPVPVELFDEGLDQAILSSVERNSKVYLQFDQQDRMDVAWRLICLSEPKQKDVSAAAGISRRQFFKMKRRMQDILEANPERTRESLADFSWSRAHRLDLENIDALPEYDEDWQRKLAAEWKRRLQETFGNKLTKNPEVFAMAIRELNSGLPQMLMDSGEWSDVRDDLWHAWTIEREQDDNPDF